MLRVVAVALGANNTAAARQTLARLLAGGFPGVDGSAIAEDTVAALLSKARRKASRSCFATWLPRRRPIPSRRKGRPARAGTTRSWPRFAPTHRRGCGGCWPGPHRRDGPGRRAPGPGVAVVRAQAAESRGPGAALSKRSGGHGDVRGVGEAVCGGQHGGDANAAGTGDQETRGCATYAGPLLPDRRTALGAAVDELPHRAVSGAEGDGRRSGRGGPGGTIPNDALRVNFRRILKRHWSEGPQILRGAGVPAGILVEPGLLAVLKSLVRENQHAKAESGQGRGGKAYDYPRPWQRPRRRRAAAERRGRPERRPTAPGTS